MSWLLGIVQASRIWAFFVFQILGGLFFKGAGIAQSMGRAMEKEPGILLSCEKTNVNPSFTEKYIQLTVSILCFTQWKEEQSFQFSPDSAALLACAVIMPDAINEGLPDLAGIWRGDLGKRQVLEEVAGLIHILAAFPLNQQENN